jgi:hypothetical protein
MKHFTLYELEFSKMATEHGIKNIPTQEVEHNLTYLVDAFLDPLREAFGAPIYISSGYRCPELNKLVGGAPDSPHLHGLGVGLQTDTKAGTRKLANLIVDMWANNEDGKFQSVSIIGDYEWIEVALFAPEN